MLEIILVYIGQGNNIDDFYNMLMEDTDLGMEIHPKK